MPFASNGNVRLVGAPRSTDGSRESVPALLIFRHEPGYPSQDCAVSHDDPALRHHPNEVPIAQPIGDVPANAQLDDFSIEHTSTVDGVAVDWFGHSGPFFWSPNHTGTPAARDGSLSLVPRSAGQPTANRCDR